MILLHLRASPVRTLAPRRNGLCSVPIFVCTKISHPLRRSSLFPKNLRLFGSPIFYFIKFALLHLFRKKSVAFLRVCACGAASRYALDARLACSASLRFYGHLLFYPKKVLRLFGSQFSFLHDFYTIFTRFCMIQFR